MNASTAKRRTVSASKRRLHATDSDEDDYVPSDSGEEEFMPLQRRKDTLSSSQVTKQRRRPRNRARRIQASASGKSADEELPRTRARRINGSDSDSSADDELPLSNRILCNPGNRSRTPGGKKSVAIVTSETSDDEDLDVPLSTRTQQGTGKCDPPRNVETALVVITLSDSEDDDDVPLSTRFSVSHKTPPGRPKASKRSKNANRMDESSEEDAPLSLRQQIQHVQEETADEVVSVKAVHFPRCMSSP